MNNEESLEKLLFDAQQHFQVGNWEATQKTCTELLRHNPHSAAALHLSGLATYQLGDVNQSSDLLQAAVKAEPNDAETWNDFGNVLQSCGRNQEALDAFRNAMRLKPSLPEAHSNVGFMLFQQGKLVESLEHFRRAIALDPTFTLAYSNLGCALIDLKRYGEAITVLKEAITQLPDELDAYVNLGDALRRSDRHAEAVEALQRGLAIEPDCPEALINLGGVHKDLGDWDTAQEAYELAIAVQPDYAEAHWNLALLLLLRGDFERGWDEFEWRRHVPNVAPGRVPLTPAWTGHALHGQTLLLIAEQGLGDTIQLVRYARQLKQYGAKVFVAAPEPLLPILSVCDGVDEVVSLDAAWPRHDCHCLLMSVPRYLTPSPDSIPKQEPYLRANPHLHQAWKERLAKFPGFKIGIGWQGNPDYLLDRHRSVPLTEFEPLSRVRDVQLISLQKGPGTEQLVAARERFSVVDLGPDLDTTAGRFMDTAAVMSNLDLVISTDTSLVHLAGALGVPVWMPTSFVPDWRWLLEREDSPWYPTLRLFRQPTRGAWQEVFQRMADELSRQRSR